MSLTLASKPTLIEWKNLRFLIMDAPKESNLHLYLKECEKVHVTHLVRISEPTYDKREVEKAGITLHVRAMLNCKTEIFLPDHFIDPRRCVSRTEIVHLKISSIDGTLLFAKLLIKKPKRVVRPLTNPRRASPSTASLVLGGRSCMLCVLKCHRNQLDILL